MNTIARSLRYLLLLCCWCLCTSLMAQRERNYIYILDCSNSMETDYHIWESTLNYLRDDIARLSPTTMVTIVPFQGQVYQDLLRHELKSDFDWAKFEKGVRPKVQELTGTNICAAWDKALTYVDQNKDNYIYLLTDGRDNKNPRPDGTENVCRRINEWCERARNAHGYFVMLSTEAADPRIKEAVKICPHFSEVDGTKHLVPFGSFERTTMNYNTLDPHTLTLSFSAEGEFDANVVTKDSLINVRLRDGKIKNGHAVLEVEVLGDLASRPDDFEVDFSITSPDVEVLNPDLKLNVRNIPERNLQLPAEQENLGKASWYDKFWWSDAKERDTLTFDLHPLFNESAVKTGSYATLKLVETTEGVTTGIEADLLLNGQPCTDGIIALKPGQPAVLSFVPNTDAREGKHYYLLQVVSGGYGNLETINQDTVIDYELTMRSQYDVRMNPLKVAMIWLAVIIGALLLLWFAVIKPLTFKRLKVFTLTISEPYYTTLTVNGALRVVCTSQPKRQNPLARIFKGKVIYEVNEAWQHEWTLEPIDDGAMISALDYDVDPIESPLQPGTEYRLQEYDNPKNRAIVSIG